MANNSSPNRTEFPPVMYLDIFASGAWMCPTGRQGATMRNEAGECGITACIFPFISSHNLLFE